MFNDETNDDKIPSHIRMRMYYVSNYMDGVMIMIRQRPSKVEGYPVTASLLQLLRHMEIITASTTHLLLLSV
jgi:hypothetical protein